MLTQNGNIYKIKLSLIEPTCLGFYFTLFLTIWSLRLVVRTSGFHPGNRGSIPLGTTYKNYKQDQWPHWSFLISVLFGGAYYITI